MTASTVDTITRDNVIAGEFPQIKQAVTVADAQTLTRGCMVGRAEVAAGTAGDLVTGGSGAETISAYALAAGGPAKIGNYRATCIIAGATGQFAVTDPNGTLVGIATVGTTFAGGGITFLITDSGGDPEVGDYFVLPVAAGALTVTALDHTLVNGSNVPYGVLLEAVTTDGATLPAVVARTGEFQSTGLTFGGSTVYTDIQAAAEDKNIYIRVTHASARVEV